MLQAVRQPLGKQEFLTQHDIKQLLDLIWQQTAALPEDDTLRMELVNRLLRLGLIPDAYVDQFRQAEEERPVNFYQVLVEQPQ